MIILIKTIKPDAIGSEDETSFIIKSTTTGRYGATFYPHRGSSKVFVFTSVAKEKLF